MTVKEFKQFQRIEHKRKVEADSEDFAIPGLAKTILAMERRIAKLEKQAKAKDTRLNNVMKRLLELEGK
jgi:hypothetical protein